MEEKKGVSSVPFTLEDLDRLRVRVGTSEKSLREMTDAQFTAWLRAIGAAGTINFVEVAPGRYVTTAEERVRILNELAARGFEIPGAGAATGAAATRAPRHDRQKVASLLAALQAATAQLEAAQSLAQELGEIDPRVNLRQALAGALALMDAARGAAERALKAAAE